MNANGVTVDQEYRKEIAAKVNNQVLSRIDPLFKRLVLSASHIAIYQLCEQQWTRCDVEGAMFIYEQQDGSFQLICINRRHPTNFTRPLVQGQSDDIEIVQEQMVSVNFDGNFYGVWFYVAEELQHFHDTILAIRNGTTSSDSAKPVSPEKKLKKRSPAKKGAPHKKVRAPIINHDSHPAAHAQPTIPPDNPLSRFFPNLRASGVVGRAMPKNAKDPMVAEKDALAAAKTSSPRGAAPSDANVALLRMLNGGPSQELAPTSVSRSTRHVVQPTQSAQMHMSTTLHGAPQPQSGPMPMPMVQTGSAPPLSRPLSHTTVAAQNNLQAHPPPQMHASMHGPMSPVRTNMPPMMMIPGMHPAHAAHMQAVQHQQAQQQQYAYYAQQQQRAALHARYAPRTDKLHDDTAAAIGSSLASMNFGDGVLDKTAFRAVIQRMLTDRKFFDSSYERYLKSSARPSQKRHV